MVNEVKLLAVVISSELKWNKHIDATVKKASMRLYALQL